MAALEGVSDPETKRKAIGEKFIEIFDIEAKKHTDVAFLAQGTLYTDVIESVSVKGPSKTIKSHHNVGGLPDWMTFELVVAAMIGAAMGWGIDALFGTLPLFLIVFILLGFGAGIRTVMRSAEELQRKQAAEAAEND